VEESTKKLLKMEKNFYVYLQNAKSKHGGTSKRVTSKSVSKKNING
jgi:hypothetical protein